MKCYVTLHVYLALVSITPLLATSYPSSDIPKAISSSGTPTVTSIINVPASADTITDVNITLDITHSWDDDLDITLIHPDGTRIELSTDNGGSNDHYTNTAFDQQAATSITSGSAPFTGTFRPEGNLDSLNGKTATGNWTLEIHDDANNDGGSLNSWSLDITTTNPDLDNDGLPNTWETANGLDPLDNGSTNPDNGPDGDPDNDGLPNIEEYQQNFNPQANDFGGRAYVARPSKATIMVVNAHPDDEGIFFGGTIPYYTQTLNVPTICISMTSGDYTLAPSVREAEYRNAAWEYGLRNQPLFPRFRDYWIDGGDINGTWDIWNDNVLGNGDEAAGKLKATEYLATQIRKFRPEVVVSHDVGGEYGHSNHAATAVATTDAFAMAADPGKDLDGLPAWQAKKLYLLNYHSDPAAVSKLFHDHWETPSIGGQTPRQVGNAGLAYHVTQGPQTVSTAYLTGEVNGSFDPFPSEVWGLHTSHVGADTTVTDFTVNGTLYSGYAKQDFLENISIDSDADLLPDDWENLYSASTVAMNPTTDTDGDGLTNYDEFLFGTDPTIPTGSNVIDFSPDGTTLTITLPASAGTGYTGVTRTYILQSSTDLSSWTDETQGTATGSAINYSLPAITTRKFYRVIVNVQ